MNKVKLWILNRKKILIFVIIAILIILSLIYYFMFYEKNEFEIISDIIETNSILEREEDEEEIKKEVNYIYVDIKGYINKPGVYKIDDSIDFRINDLITLAGGLKKDADTSIINLSTKLKDEMVIIIYSKEEVKNFMETLTNTKNKLKICETQSIINDGCIKETNIDTNTQSIVNDKININNANKDQLMTLPGIGESKANSIIEYRNNNGLFNSIEDIKNVSGIGDKFFEQIKDYITI